MIDKFKSIIDFFKRLYYEFDNRNIQAQIQALPDAVLNENFIFNTDLGIWIPKPTSSGQTLLDIKTSLTNLETLVNISEIKVESTTITLQAQSNYIIEYETDNRLFNCLVLGIKNVPENSHISGYVYLYDNILECSLASEYIFEQWKGTTKTIFFRPSHNIKIELQNTELTDQLEFTYSLIYSNAIDKETNLYNLSINNTEKVLWIDRPDKLFNRLSIILRDTSTINATITIQEAYKVGVNFITVETETITTGTTYYATYEFPAHSQINLKFKNNQTSTLDVFAHLFFSNSKNQVSDLVYSSAWNGITDIAPSKNTVYDKIESLGGGLPDISNPAWIQVPFQLDRYGATHEYAYKYCNLSGQDEEMLFNIPMPRTILSKKLYISGIIIGVNVADASNYVNQVILEHVKYNGMATWFSDSTNLTTSQIKTYEFTPIDCSNAEGLQLCIKTVVSTADYLRIPYVKVRYYYD